MVSNLKKFIVTPIHRPIPTQPFNLLKVEAVFCSITGRTFMTAKKQKQPPPLVKSMSEKKEGPSQGSCGGLCLPCTSISI